LDAGGLQRRYFVSYRMFCVDKQFFNWSPPASWNLILNPVKRARDASLQVKGSNLFNLIPLELRGISGTVDQLKSGLDKWLSSIPDQPTVGSRQRAAKANFLLDQVPLNQNTS
jgi:hypothetical protein